ncbi:MAG: hypothetical protein LCH90_06200 [Proteobacteria bacterium]|nr:hypothetical protein [Pseudomonadota bacterium]
MIESELRRLMVSFGNDSIRLGVNFFRGRRRSSWAIMAGAVCLMQFGCAILEPKSSEDVVRERAQAYWDAVVTGKWEKAYGYTTPGFRTAVDLFGFRSRVAAQVKLRSAEVVNVSCKDAVCEATMRLGVQPLLKGYPETTTDLTERWVQGDGEWWRFERY